jgi:hypothetical protein
MTWVLRMAPESKSRSISASVVEAERCPIAHFAPG